MSVRFCGKCGAGWGPDFNFCAKDGTALNVAPIAQLGVSPASHEEEPVSKPTSRKLARKPGIAAAAEAPPTQIEPGNGKVAGKLSRAPAEAPVRHAADFDMPDLDLSFDVTPAPRIEGPATRGRRRPAKEHAATSEISRAIKEIAAEPVEHETVEALRGEANVESIFTAKKRRDAAAFSETAWFRRPIEATAVDPVSGKVSHNESTYRPDPTVTHTQRRKFSLRRSGEAV
jgi:hypothetical protein